MAEIKFSEPITCRYFFCGAKPPARKRGCAWADTSTLMVRKWVGGQWASVSEFTLDDPEGMFQSPHSPKFVAAVRLT